MDEAERKVAGGQRKYSASKGIPNDRAGRQMNHYFNMDEWQEKMNARQGSSKKARYGW